MNLTPRRAQLHEKLGLGLIEAQWHEERSIHNFGHRGLVESAHLCALAMGWTVQTFHFERSPIVDDEAVTGLVEVVHIFADTDRSLELRLEFKVDGVDVDEIMVSGTSSVEMQFRGIPGDDATVARMVHTAKHARALRPGLRLPLELPIWSTA